MTEEYGQKVLVIGYENCNLIYNIACGIKAVNKYRVHTAVFGTDAFFTKSKYDFDLSIPYRQPGNKYVSKLKHMLAIQKYQRNIKRFERAYYDYDIYIFTWQSYKKDCSDLKELKKRGKKIIFLFIGSDIRWLEAFHQEYPQIPYNANAAGNWTDKFRLVRSVELNATSIFSLPDQSGLLMRPYYHMFMPVNLSNIQYTPQSRKRPLIIHAPSKRDVKGTSVILEAIQKLASEGLAFDFEILENLDNEKVLKKLEDADILIDQIYLHGPATLASEAMAAGCAVAARFIRSYGLTKDAPLCYVDETCVEDALRKLIVDMDYRKSLISRSREFVEANNSIPMIISRIFESIEREKRGSYDYMPDFFQKKFKLPVEYTYSQEIEMLNNQVLSKYGKNSRTVQDTIEK